MPSTAARPRRTPAGHFAASSATEVRALAAGRLRSSGLLEHPEIGTWLRSVVEAAEQGT